VTPRFVLARHIRRVIVRHAQRERPTADIIHIQIL